MRKFFNRTITRSMLAALALCAVLVAVCLLPSAASAAEESETEALVSLIDGETETEYASFSDAIAHIQDGMTVRFLKDGEMSKFYVKVGFTIDLNGKNVYVNGGIVRCSYLTILDSTVDKKGTLSILGNNGLPLQPEINGTMSFESGTIKNNGLIFDGSTTIHIRGANIDTYVLAGTESTVNMTGGYVRELDYRNAAYISGGEIGTLTSGNGNVTLSGGTIGQFKFSDGATFHGMLQDDCAFQKADGSALIRFSEMNADTAVNIVPCPHDSFRDAENMICDFCDRAMNVSVSDAAGTKYYVGLAAACAGLANGDTIKLLNDIDVKDGVKGPEIKANDVTFDFNGKKFDGIYGVISIYTKVTIVDTAGGGYGFFSVTTDRAGNVSDVVIDASADTKIGISYYSGTVKLRNGQLVKISFANAHDLTELLPEGYRFAESGNSGLQYLTWEQCVGNSKSEKYNKEDNGYILTAEKCTHPSYDADLTCDYCHATVPAGKAINRVSAELAAAQNELQEAIDQKADAATINAKIAQLNEAIQNAEAAKAYADEKDAALKADLVNAIATAKSEAIRSSKDALDKATEELTAKIAEKANASEVDTAIKDLTAAIANAQTVNNAYVDEKSGALKTELEGKIAKAQEEVTAAISALSARLEAVENKTNTLQTVLIVFIVVLSLANVASVATFVIRKRR